MDYQLARNVMVAQQIRPWHVLDDKVLTLMANTPREYFVPEAYRTLAYSDSEIPLEEGQVMLAPKIVARALQALQIQPKDKVLEIGTGTGYITALLAQLSQSITSIENRQTLYDQAKKNLMSYPSLSLILGDGANGWAQNKPYDVIFATGSYPNKIPNTLLSQLNEKGRLFVVFGKLPIMQALLITKKYPEGIHQEALFETFIPPLDNTPKSSHFEW